MGQIHSQASYDAKYIYTHSKRSAIRHAKLAWIAKHTDTIDYWEVFLGVAGALLLLAKLWQVTS